MTERPSVDSVEHSESVVTYMSDGSEYRRYGPHCWMGLTGMDEYTVTDEEWLEAAYQSWLAKPAT